MTQKTKEKSTSQKLKAKLTPKEIEEHKKRQELGKQLQEAEDRLEFIKLDYIAFDNLVKALKAHLNGNK